MIKLNVNMLLKIKTKEEEEEEEEEEEKKVIHVLSHVLVRPYWILPYCCWLRRVLHNNSSFNVPKMYGHHWLCIVVK